jgi:hypothetical protein
MKSSSLIVGGLLCASILITPAVTLAATTPSAVVTEEKSEPVATEAVEQIQTMPQVAKVEYVLPYPGVLLDNPLYFLKQWRDRIMEWLIADPIRKTEFYVLQSDKNLNAGIMLQAQGKLALMMKVVSTASSDMEKAVTSATTAKGQGKEVPPYVIEHLTNALAKHVEVLSSMVSQLSGEEKAAAEKSLESMNVLTASVAKLK